MPARSYVGQQTILAALGFSPILMMLGLPDRVEVVGHDCESGVAEPGE